MRSLSLLAIAILGLSSCAAGKATYLMIDADRAWRDAVEAEAEEKAPYEFTLAALYRDKAWEEWGYSQYDAAEALAATAADYARQAERIALYGDEERELMDELESYEATDPLNGGE